MSRSEPAMSPADPRPTAVVGAQGGEVRPANARLPVPPVTTSRVPPVITIRAVR